MSIEYWKDIPGYENLYQASNLGQIRSLNYRNTGKTHIIKPAISRRKSKNHRLYAHLSKDGTTTQLVWARCIWSAFNGPIPDGMQCNHIDENTENSRLDNLNLMTCKENINWGTGIERRRKKSMKPVVQILKDGTEFFCYFSAIDAKRELGISNTDISSCCNGKLNTAGGYVWKYAKK